MTYFHGKAHVLGVKLALFTKARIFFISGFTGKKIRFRVGVEGGGGGGGGGRKKINKKKL